MICKYFHYSFSEKRKEEKENFILTRDVKCKERMKNDL